MTKTLQYLFLMNLLGVAALANAEPNGGEGVPQEMRRNVDRQETKEPATKRMEAPMPTFTEEVNNNPLLWMVGSSILNTFIGFFMLALAVIFSPDRILHFSRLVISYITSLLIHVLLSLLTASWASRWVNESQKGEGVVLPSFQDRFWRSFRFIVPLSVPIPITIFILTAFILDERRNFGDKFLIWIIFPLLASILSYVAIWVYGYWQRQKQETKPIPKKDPLLP